MGNKTNIIEASGIVVEILPGEVFKIKLDENDVIIYGHISGKLRINHIRILPGDHVRVELSVYDLTQGRIIYRDR